MRTISWLAFMLVLLLILALHFSGCGLIYDAYERILSINYNGGPLFFSSSNPSSTSVHADVVHKATEITGGARDEYETILAVYNWVTSNISYDVEKYHSRVSYSPDPVHTLHTRQGICGDYAKLTEQLLLAAGIEAVIKSGDVVTDHGTELHAWNEVVAEGTVYALDTTWGSGYLTEDLKNFIRRPTLLFFTSPEELNKLHKNPDYLQEQKQKLRRQEALAAPTHYAGGFEEQLLILLNNERSGNRALQNLSKLHQEARILAEIAAQKECRGETLALDLKENLDRLNHSAPYISRLSANIYFYWSHAPVTSDELYRFIMNDGGGNNNLLSADFNSIGIGVVKRGDLYVICHLLGTSR